VNKPRRIRAALALALMVAAAIGAHAWRPTQHLSDLKAKVELEQMFPLSIGSWSVDTSGPVQLISPDQKALLNKLYNQTLSRTYVNKTGDRMMLSVAYGGDQSDGTQAHRPDVCYPAQGFDILARSTSDVQLPGKSLPTRQLLARMGGRFEPISYWFVVGDRVALGGTEQKLIQLAYSTRGVIPDGLLVRVSTIDKDSQRAYKMQADFVREMFGAMQPGARERIFGSEGAANAGRISSASQFDPSNRQ
jgi:EpsI family protein